VRQARAPVIEVVDNAVAAVLRRKSGGERLRMVDALYRSARRLIEANVRLTHPDWDAAATRREVARRMAGGTD
jgi:hypothetical protein